MAERLVTSGVELAVDDGLGRVVTRPAVASLWFWEIARVPSVRLLPTLLGLLLVERVWGVRMMGRAI